MRTFIVVTVAGLLASCQGKRALVDMASDGGGVSDAAALEAGPADTLVNVALDMASTGDGPPSDARAEVAPGSVTWLPDEAAGAQPIAPVTIIFENPSARPLYLLPGCVSEFTISPEAGGFQEPLGHREFCLCECDTCTSAPTCQSLCAPAWIKKVPAGGEARLRWIPRSFERELLPTYSCERSHALPVGKYRLWAVVYDSASPSVGWTGAPVFGVSKDFELPVPGSELRVPLADPGPEGAPCTALAACCPKLVIPEYAATCKSTVTMGVQPRCHQALEGYRQDSACR